MSAVDMAIRLGVASLFGLVLGLDRELRGKSAGIRTHALVSLSSAVITLSAMLLFVEARAAGTDSLDPLRVIQGLAQAIGFIAAGLIFVSRGGVHNLTSAANIWLATAIGIACGAGQMMLAGLSLAFGILILTVVRVAARWLPRSGRARED